MKTPFHSSSKPARFFGVALSLAMTLAGYGALAMPAAAFAAQSPVVDQQPLTVQPTIPPDIVLMLDDSGSMRWNFMPDWDFLNNNGDNDAVIDAANNGVYYDPATTYSPPPHADGASSYTTQTDMTDVPEDGFGVRTTQSVSLFTYDGSLDYHESSSGAVESGSKIDYNVTVNVPTMTVHTSIASDSDCGTMQKQQGADSYAYDSASEKCTLTFNQTPYFQYSTGPADGPYVVHYVTFSTADCANAPTPSNCVAASDTSGVAAPSGVAASTNIANWFAYYHTRILMAKTGLMTGFSGLNTTFRFGFGSINGQNNGDLPSPNATFGGKEIAEVQPFGDGSALTQKAYFWNWVANLQPDNSTPLRQALDAVGQYYEDSQPWTSMTGDPGYNPAPGATNSPLACRGAYTILTTDGFWNGNFSSSTIAGASDAAGTQVTGPDNQKYTYSPAAPYSGGGTGIANSPSLADVALHYWETDLQSGLDNEVPLPRKKTEDPAFWQHMVTFTMGLGFSPLYADQKTVIPVDQVFDWAQGGTAISGFSWPTPAGSGGSGGSINNIADLAHAGVNGHGAFYSATSAQAFTAGIKSAVNRVAGRAGTGASLAANSTQLSNGSVIYQSSYQSSAWTGDLTASAINPADGTILTSPKPWLASTELPAADSRDIQTFNPSTGKFVDFKNGAGTPPSLSAAQLTALGSTATEQEAIVDYLRGDSANEDPNGLKYRDRDTALGDIVDSQPVYSGPPDPNEFLNQNFLGTITDSSGTVPFFDWAVGTTDSTTGVFTASAASTRAPLIFVAANDGMLHAFNAPGLVCTTDPTTQVRTCTFGANAGKEVYAYLPGAVITAGLKNLSDPGYGGAADPHQYYNDGQLTIADAYIDTGDGNGQSWHTILVGTTGRGPAEAVYALDVTDPSDIKPLWERSAGDAGVAGDSPSNANTYIGQMVGKPVIAQTNYVPATKTTAASSTWSVLMGNGYNSASGQAALLQFNLATGALNVHTTTDTTAGNGLAAPVAWMDSNSANTDASIGVSDIAYAGDLHGQVWSFQLNDATGANPSPTSTGSLLFTAKDSSGNVQPITAGMLAGQDPSTSSVWLFFGTGEYLNSADLTSTSTQTWYGIIAQSCTTSTKKGTTTSTCSANTPGSRSNLTQRTITAQTTASGTTLPARTVSSEVIDTANNTTDMTGKQGWYLDLVGPNAVATDPSERMVDANQFQGTVLIGVTRIPPPPGSDICKPSGTGWVMALNPFTGAAPSNNFFDVNGDGSVNNGDLVSGSVAAGIGFTSLPNAPIFVGGVMETSFDNGSMSSITTAGSGGTVKRVSWREVVN